MGVLGGNYVLCQLSGYGGCIEILSVKRDLDENDEVTLMLKWQVGLLYDEESLAGALDIINDWTDRERAMLRRKVMSI